MRSALTPSVAMSGVTPKRVTAMPLTRPAAAQASTTTPRAGTRSPASSLGMTVTRTVAREIIPGIDRSRPRCWTTSVCPIDAIARIDAFASVAATTLTSRLPRAKSGLTRKRIAVAGQIGKNGLRTIAAHRVEAVMRRPRSERECLGRRRAGGHDHAAVTHRSLLATTLPALVAGGDRRVPLDTASRTTQRPTRAGAGRGAVPAVRPQRQCQPASMRRSTPFTDWFSRRNTVAPTTSAIVASFPVGVWER